MRAADPGQERVDHHQRPQGTEQQQDEVLHAALVQEQPHPAGPAEVRRHDGIEQVVAASAP